MHRLVHTLLALLIAAATAIVATPQAHADIYEMWRFDDGRICLEDHGWTRWPFAEATAAWAASDVSIVNWNDCSSQPRNMTIIIKTYNDPLTFACAKTGSDTHTWAVVHTAKSSYEAWTPDAMVIWMNMAPVWYNRCHSTPEYQSHVLAHELGHALGQGHPESPNTGDSHPSIMDQWKYQLPTWLDIARINVRY